MEDSIKCMECGKSLKMLVKHIMCKHDMTTKEYAKRYPNAPMEAKSVSLKRWKSTKAHIMKTYGVGNWMNVDHVKDKAERNMRKTFLQKYGVSHPMKSKFVVDQYRKSIMKKYGTSSVMQVESILEKQRARYLDTCLDRYGVDNTFSVMSIQKKASISNGKRRMNKIESMVAKAFHDLNYVGDGTLWIRTGGKNRNPDFIHEASRKVVEVFGEYWHGPEKTGVAKGAHEKNVISDYMMSGYECIVVWESEIMNDFGSVAKNISSFMRDKAPQRLHARPRAKHTGEDIVRSTRRRVGVKYAHR